MKITNIGKYFKLLASVPDQSKQKVVATKASIHMNITGQLILQPPGDQSRIIGLPTASWPCIVIPWQYVMRFESTNTMSILLIYTRKRFG